jgi:hypothetical protein
VPAVILTAATCALPYLASLIALLNRGVNMSEQDWQPWQSSTNQGGQQPDPDAGRQQDPYGGHQYAQPQPGQPPNGQPGYVLPPYVPPQDIPAQGAPSQYGQPQYGQPQYGQPQYGQPQYGQPQYGQPQFAQPQVGTPQYSLQYVQPLYGLPQPPQPSRRGLWIGLVAAVALVLMLGAAVIWIAPFGDHLPSTDAGASPPKSTVTVALPDTLAGRAKILDSEHAQIAADSVARMKLDAHVVTAVVGFYGTPDPTQNKVYVAAATTDVGMSKAAFDANFDEASKTDGLSDMTDLTDVDPGPIGGYARCARFKIATIPSATCLWGDVGSFGMVMWYNRQLTNEVKAELLIVRSAVETKGA